MFFDAAMMARARAEVERAAQGARVREVAQLAHDEILLVFARSLPAAGLLLSSSPEFGRVGFELPGKPAASPNPFGMALRKHLRGARLQSVRQAGFDRVLRLEFEGCLGFGRECRRALIVEVMGKHGNMVLVDEHELILSCAKHVPGRLNRYREIMEGEPYIPPPRFDKLDPREATAEEWRERGDEETHLQLREFLTAHCLGTSKVLSAETAHRLERASSETPAGPWSALAEALRGFAREAESEGPVYVYEPLPALDLPARFAYPLRLGCCGEAVGQEAHLGAALAPLIAAEREARRTREVRQRLTGAAAAQLRELGRRLERWREKIKKAETAEGDREIGELLLSQPQAALPYAETAEIADYFADGAPMLTVKLDPPGDLLATAERHFARYKRARRVLEKVPPLLESAEEESRYLESVLAELELAEGPEDLDAIEAELAQEGYLRAKQRAAGRGRGPVAPKPRTLTSRDGYSILYGTNHLQNDEVVRVAAPDDLWLHAQGAPGAHVLIRTGGRPDKVPRTTLAEAARLAAWWSRRRSEGTVEVDYTLAKHVRKAKGERPGKVHYTHQKTLTVRV